VALSTRTALVAGASGLVGGRVLHQLLEDPTYSRVTVLARRELPVSHKKLEQRIATFDRLAQIADFPRVHDVFCCLGTTMKQAGSPDAFRKVESGRALWNFTTKDSELWRSAL